MSLLENNIHWNDTLSKGRVSASSETIREHFAEMLVFCSISKPAEVWLQHKDNFSEDIQDIIHQISNADLSLHKEDVEITVCYSCKILLCPLLEIQSLNTDYQLHSLQCKLFKNTDTI